MIKTPEEIAKLHEGGKLLSGILREIRAACVEGATSVELNDIALRRMKEHGATPSFLGYRIGNKGSAYPGALCVSMNEEVVHGLPIPSRTFKRGDVVGLDIGMWYKGLATDMATTVIVGDQANEQTRALVADTRESLVRGLSAIRAGGMIYDIGAAVEDYLKPKKYGIVKDLVGHGVGHAVHEDPPVPNYREDYGDPVVMQTGMVLAIEPMVTLGTWRVRTQPDQWTIVTADKSVAAHFEVTVEVTDTGYKLITPWPDR